MRARRPHYFLRTHAAAPPAPPRWAFSLQAADHSPAITAEDFEQDASCERLQLLAVVRGLEALPEPATVILATASDVVRRGIKHGLEEWREMDWQLELFGELIPVKNADLWRRIDRALAIHDVQIRNVRIDEPIVAEQAELPHFEHAATPKRRGQTTLAGTLSTARAAEAWPSVGNHDSLDSAGGWSDRTATQRESWASGPSFDDEDGLEGDPWSLDCAPAQKSGRAIGKAGLAKNAPIQNRGRDCRNMTSEKRPFRPFSLLRLRRRLRASRLHVQRRIAELWSSWLWFYEVSGLQQLGRTRRPLPPPWLRDPPPREEPHRR